MRHQRNFIDLRQGVQAGPGGAELRGAQAQAVHAAVHFQEYAVRLVRFVRRQHVDLRLAMHRVPQPQARAPFQVAGVKYTF